jgi:hypothetical protein
MTRPMTLVLTAVLFASVGQAQSPTTVCGDKSVVPRNRECEAHAGVDDSATAKMRKAFENKASVMPHLRFVAAAGTQNANGYSTEGRRGVSANGEPEPEEGIVVLKSVYVELAYTTSIHLSGFWQSCSPGVVHPVAFMHLTSPGSAETGFLAVTSDKLYPDNQCLGDHTAMVQGYPLAGLTPGLYTLRLESTAVNYTYTGSVVMSYSFFPTVRIWVDGIPVVNASYTAGADPTKAVAETWHFVVH